MCACDDSQSARLGVQVGGGLTALGRNGRPLASSLYRSDMAAEVLALWFSDIEGSTQVLLRTGDAYEQILERHRQVVRDAFATFGAEECGTEGDSFFAVFPTGGAAAGAAIAVQRALDVEAWPVEGRIAIRIGLHLGEVRRHAHNEFTGLAVHLAARVMAAAYGGQILVTRAVKDQLDPSVDLLDLGEHELKDIPQSVALSQLVAPGLRRDFPPPRTATRRRHVQLPPLTTSFVGREHELATARRRLDGARLVSFVGPPGCGKTRLSLELARQMTPDYDLVSFVDLATVERSARVGLAIALAAGVEGDGDPVQATAAMIGDRAALLVLDNCEHLLDSVGAAVRTLVDGCPALKIVATSQTPLGHLGESVLSIGGLADATTDDHPARQLFVDRCAARGVDIGASHMAAVDELVGRLDGIPLAIELAASLATTLSPREMVERLDRRFELLVADGDVSNARHSTLQSAIEWGFSHLSEHERRLAGHLAICAGSFDMAAAEAMAAGLADGTVLADLHRLVRSSWLVRTDGVVGSRYRMLESLREFARNRLDEQDRASARRAHAHHFLRTLDQGPLGEDLPREAADFALIDEDLPNILLALQWAINENADLDAAAEMFLALSSYWQARPSWREPYVLGEELLSVCRGAVDPGLEAELLDSKAFYEMMVAGIRSTATVDEAGEVARRSGSLRARLRWLHMAAQVYGADDVRESMRFATMLVDEATAARSRRYAQMGLLRRGMLRLQTEGVAAGKADIERGVAVGGDRAHLASLTFAHNNLANLAFGAGDLAAAQAHAEQAMIAAARSDHRIAEITSRVTAAAVSGDVGRERAELEAAIESARRLGTASFRATLHRNAASAALCDRDPDAAAQHLAAADALDQTTGDGATDAWLVRAAVYRATARAEDAADAVAGLRRTLEHAHRNGLVGRVWVVVWVLAGWGQATDDRELNLRLRAAAERAFAVFSAPQEGERLYGIAPMDGPTTAAATAADPIALDEAVAAVLGTADGGVRR